MEEYADKLYNYKLEAVKFSTLLGKTLVEIYLNADKTELFFKTEEGEIFVLYHQQTCCECVELESAVGDWNDIVGAPLLFVEEVESERKEYPDGFGDGETWTFYKLATQKGYMDLRWCGSSNGYYSESVDFAKIAGTGRGDD